MTRPTHRCLLLALTAACGGTETLTEVATITTNGPYDLNYGDPALVHSVVLQYDACPTVTEVIRVEAASQSGVGSIEATPTQRACLDQLVPGHKATVTIKASKHWLSGQASWQVETIDECDVSTLDGTVRTEGSPCPWM